MGSSRRLGILGLLLAVTFVVSASQRDQAKAVSTQATSSALTAPRQETGGLSRIPPPQSFGPTPTVPAVGLGVRSGDAGDPTGTVAFGNWLGRQPTLAVDFTATDSWSVIANPWLIPNWAAWKAQAPGRVLVLSVPMHPDNPSSAWRYNGSVGAYNANYVTLAHHLVDAGLGDTVIRLGWEMNISDIGQTPAQWQQWIAYWRQIVAGMRSVPGQAFKFDWDVQIGNGPDLSQFYPGNDVVDYIGLDVYDVFWDHCNVSPTTRWNYILTEHNGLNDQRSFALAHGKQMSYPEWGLWPQAVHCGGQDDPYFIDQMANWFSSNPVAYQSYFDEGDFRLTYYPLSRAEYKAKIG